MSLVESKINTFQFRKNYCKVTLVGVYKTKNIKLGTEKCPSAITLIANVIHASVILATANVVHSHND